jgi:hypothetical protein
MVPLLHEGAWMLLCNAAMRLGLMVICFGEVFVEDKPVVPGDFKLVARYRPGFSDSRPWEYTITADGKVVQEIGRGGNGTEKPQKQNKLSQEDLGALVTTIKKADFFKLKEHYRGEVTDLPTLILEITMDKKTLHVLVYGYQFLKEKDDQLAADRFLSVWSEVIRKIPSPNPEQTPDRYKPGNYRNG